MVISLGEIFLTGHVAKSKFCGVVVLIFGTWICVSGGSLAARDLTIMRKPLHVGQPEQKTKYKCMSISEVENVQGLRTIICRLGV